MDYRKRARLYIARKKGTAFGMFCFVLVISTFLICSFSILNASERLSKDIRESLGGAFYLRASKSVTLNEDGESEVMENRISVTEETIGQILSCGDIAYYNPINYGYAKGDGLSFIPGSYHSEENNMGQITALKYSALASDFMDGTVSLLEGEHIVEHDTNSVLISSELAETNHLTVGDQITLESAELAEENGQYIDGFTGERGQVTVTVVGIYAVNLESVTETPTAGKPENMIYASPDVLLALNESEAGTYTGEVDFYVTDPAALNEIVSEVQQLETIDWTTHFIRTNDFQYSKVSDSLLSLRNLVKLLLVCISAVSAVILVLILVLRIRGRVYEMGVLIASGVTKKEILGQFLLENLLVAAAAILLSCFTSLGSLRILGDYLLGDFELNFVNADVLNGISSGISQAGNYLRVGIIQMLVIYLCETLVIAGAVLMASSTVIRLKPREILSKMS